MSNINLFKNNEKVPFYKGFSHILNQEKKKTQNLFQKPAYQSNVSEPANTLFTYNCSWEYFSNELEFE